MFDSSLPDGFANDSLQGITTNLFNEAMQNIPDLERFSGIIDDFQGLDIGSPVGKSGDSSARFETQDGVITISKLNDKLNISIFKKQNDLPVAHLGLTNSEYLGFEYDLIDKTSNMFFTKRTEFSDGVVGFEVKKPFLEDNTRHIFLNFPGMHGVKENVMVITADNSFLLTRTVETKDDKILLIRKVKTLPSNALSGVVEYDYVDIRDKGLSTISQIQYSLDESEPTPEVLSFNNAELSANIFISINPNSDLSQKNVHFNGIDLIWNLGNNAGKTFKTDENGINIEDIKRDANGFMTITLPIKRTDLSLQVQIEPNLMIVNILTVENHKK